MSIIQAMLRNVTFHEKCVICHMTYVTLHMIYVIYALKNSNTEVWLYMLFQIRHETPKNITNHSGNVKLCHVS